MAFIFKVAAGIIRDQSQRRMAMFVVVATALVLLFLGSAFLHPFLFARPFLFILYWMSCIWMTLLAFLLAAFDLLMLRKARRAERRRLQEKYLRREE